MYIYIIALWIAYLKILKKHTDPSELRFTVDTYANEFQDITGNTI